MHKKEKFNLLFIEDKGYGDVTIKLNNQDITKGITKYSISRLAETNETVIVNLEMVVIPEKICIKKNQKSSND